MEPAGWGGRGERLTQKEVHIVKRSNSGTELEILNDILALKRVLEF